jgi:hypothetical protein
MIKKFLVFSISFIFFNFVLSCSDDAPDIIVGEWQLISVGNDPDSSEVRIFSEDGHYMSYRKSPKRTQRAGTYTLKKATIVNGYDYYILYDDNPHRIGCCFFEDKMRCLNLDVNNIKDSREIWQRISK